MTQALALLTVVDRLVDQVRALPESRLRQGVAADVLALARELSARAQRLEFPDREPRTIPEVGLFAVGDQLAVAAHDLVVARAASAVGGPGELAADQAVVVATARRCGLAPG